MSKKNALSGCLECLSANCRNCTCECDFGNCEAQQWISVKDKLPNANIEVLVYGKLIICDHQLGLPEIYVCRYTSQPIPEWIRSYDDKIVKEVTFWMHLPEEPKLNA